MGNGVIDSSDIDDAFLLSYDNRRYRGMAERYGLELCSFDSYGVVEIGANILEPLDEPLHKEIIASGNVHGDESTLGCKDQRLPGKGETIEDVEDELHFFKRWIFCYYAPMLGLTQFVFHERGRRTVTIR